MAKKFDPAPADKFAVPPKKAVEKDLRLDELDQSLEDTFPASDPLSETQPKTSKY